MKRTLYGCLAAATVLLAAGAAHAVDWKVAPGGAGTSTAWGAPGNLQATLVGAAAGDRIFVQQGKYVPGPTRAHTFTVNPNITVLGGFPPGGGPLASRNPAVYVTILDGDIGVADDPADNNYHVITALGGTIDGFVIQHGNADGAGGASSIYGGGVYVTGTTILDRCNIVRNTAASGGGVYFSTNQPGTALTIRRSTIIDNHALGPAGTPALLGNGGGVLADFSPQGAYVGVLTMNQCSLLGNTAAATGGGVCAKMDTGITNTVFSGNFADADGGGAFIVSLPGPGLGKVHNCTFAYNTTNQLLGDGGALLSHVWLANSIFWKNQAGGGPMLDQQFRISVGFSEYTDAQGGPAPGVGNLGVNPQFVNELGGDGLAGTIDDNLRLLMPSPCVDVGNNAVAAVPVDRDGNNRIRIGKLFGALVVDMGAYERGVFDPIEPGDIVANPVGVSAKVK